jgi:hypothetical protein
MATANAINANSTGIQKYDGAGTFSGITLTQFSPLVGAASNGITSLGPLTNGQIVIGSTGVSPVATTITPGSGISVTNGAGTITIAGTTGVIWSTVTVDASATVGQGIIANKAGLLTMTLPAVSSVGDVVAITGMNNATGWKIAQPNAGSQIFFGTSATTLGVTGFLASTNTRDTVYMVCVTANATWNVLYSVGNITVS